MRNVPASFPTAWKQRMNHSTIVAILPSLGLSTSTKQWQYLFGFIWRYKLGTIINENVKKAGLVDCCLTTDEGLNVAWVKTQIRASETSLLGFPPESLPYRRMRWDHRSGVRKWAHSFCLGCSSRPKPYGKGKLGTRHFWLVEIRIGVSSGAFALLYFQYSVLRKNMGGTSLIFRREASMLPAVWKFPEALFW